MGNTFLYSLTLQNFQKYKESTFVFSRHGNLITGVNGSGKSTIAAAIALVLGGTNKTIGKALAVHELIKYGETKAYAELVIRTERRSEISKVAKISGTDKEISIAISRTITLTGSTYKINNIPASLNQVREITEALDIQINNLAQFLPQDRVTEFSSLAEEEQLETTLKTCRPALLEKKKELEELDDKLAQSKKKLHAEIEEQEHLSTRMLQLEEESRKLKEFLERKEKISLLQCKIKWVEYQTIKEERDKVKEKLADVEKKYTEQQEKIELLEKECSERHGRLSLVKEEAEKQIDTTQFKKCVDEIKINEKEERSALEETNMLQSRISRLEQEKLEMKQWKEVKEGDKPLGKFTAHLQEEYHKLEEEYRKSKMEDSAWQIESALKASEIKNIEMSLKKDEEVETRLLELLKTLHADTYTVLTLMKNDQKKWDVDLPAILSMKVTREEYKEELSSQLSIHALTSFVCHTRESFLEFTREFKDKRNLAINVVEKQHSTSTADLVQRAGVPIDRKYDMIYLSECVEAPPAVKEFLNIFSRLSLIPVTKTTLSDEQQFFQEHRRITRVISNKRVIEIKRSPYTPDETLVIYPIPRGIDILAQPLHDGLKETLEKLKQEREQRAEYRQTVLKKREQLEKRLKELKQLKEIDINENEKYERMKRAAQAYKERSEEIIQEISEIKEKQNKIKNALKRIKKEGVVFWKNLPITELLEGMQKLSENSKLMRSQYEELEQKQHILLAEKQNLKELHRDTLKFVQEAENLKKQAKQKQAEAESTYQLKPEDEKSRQKLKDMPTCVKTLTSQLAQEKARVDLSIVDYSAIEEYESCKMLVQQKINRIKKEEKETGRQESIKKQKETQLKTEIYELLKNINEHASVLFKSAGISAEVCVDCPESSRAWKLVIKVQFRAEAKPEVLSAGRHSGGEKAVSIILYLLSMQRLSNAPFLLVDEINQGMDANHEKTIHSLLVGNKSSSKAQTIVITPKLISGLDYSPTTKVHIIIENS